MYNSSFISANLMKTDLDDCVDAFVAAAKNSSMTGQNIQIGKANS